MNLNPGHATQPKVAPSPDTKATGRLIAVLGGKGGVGKTNVATNLAVAAAGLGARVLLVDGDLGLANVDVLLGLTPRATSAEVLSGDCDFEGAQLVGPAGLHVIPAASARMDLASSRPVQLKRLLAPLLAAAFRYDLVLIDIGSGVSAQVASLASVCDLAFLVTTPEPTSVTDAYGTLKVLRSVVPELRVELLVNIVRDELEALATHRQLEQVGQRFLGHKIPLRGFLNRDPRLVDAVAAQRAVVEAFPSATVSRQLINLAAGLVKDIKSANPAPTREYGWRRMIS